MNEKLRNERLLDSVFVLTGYPEHTYVNRRKIDMVMKSMLGDKGTHIFLVGDTKTGKSSLWKNYIDSNDVIELKITDDGASINCWTRKVRYNNCI